MGELQTKRDAQTRAELSSAAIALFATHGYVETTMEDVAVAAGVSRRTAYRHFPNKEELLFEPARHWLDVFHQTVADRKANESTRELCERAVLAVAAFIDLSRQDVLPAYGVIGATPSLWSRFGRTNRDWLDTYTQFLSAEYPAADASTALRVSILAGALVGGTDRAASHWAADQSVSLVALTELVLKTVDPLWSGLGSS